MPTSPNPILLAVVQVLLVGHSVWAEPEVWSDRMCWASSSSGTSRYNGAFTRWLFLACWLLCCCSLCQGHQHCTSRSRILRCCQHQQILRKQMIFVNPMGKFFAY